LATRVPEGARVGVSDCGRVAVVTRKLRTVFAEVARWAVRENLIRLAGQVIKRSGCSAALSWLLWAGLTRVSLSAIGMQANESDPRSVFGAARLGSGGGVTNESNRLGADSRGFARLFPQKRTQRPVRPRDLSEGSRVRSATCGREPQVYARLCWSQKYLKRVLRGTGSRGPDRGRSPAWVPPTDSL
jgi:hypothetical protein